MCDGNRTGAAERNKRQSCHILVEPASFWEGAHEVTPTSTRSKEQVMTREKTSFLNFLGYKRVGADGEIIFILS